VNPFANVSLSLTAAGAAAVMTVLIICITLLVMNDKPVPDALYLPVGALAALLCFIAVGKD
jgi:hypothetical protein